MLEAAAHPLFDGWGRGEDLNWEPEQSLLALGVGKAQAIELGRRFGQNAVVWGTAGGLAELLDCRG